MRAVSAFTSSCGACWACSHDLSARCVRSQLLGHKCICSRGPDAAIDAEDDSAGLHGAQSEFVRIPLARHSLLVFKSTSTAVDVPASLPALTDEQALLLADILPTALFAALNARVGLELRTRFAFSDVTALISGVDVPPVAVAARFTRVYAVLGCGPVGLLTVACAQALMHAAGVGHTALLFAFDPVPERLRRAVALGATPLAVPAGEVISDALRKRVCSVDGSTGVGCDAVMECVGSPVALSNAFHMLRPGGTLSSIGVHSHGQLPFSPAAAYDKNVTFITGRCPARSLMHAARAVLEFYSRRGVDLVAMIVSHRLPLARAAEAYDMFARRVDGCSKVLLMP